jgi:hypothetical protein
MAKGPGLLREEKLARSSGYQIPLQTDISPFIKMLRTGGGT